MGIPLPGYVCKQALADAQLRAAIAAIADCLPTCEDVQSIADELTQCTPLYAVQDIYTRLLTAALCCIQSGGQDISCSRPWDCEYLTVNTEESINDLYLYDPFSPGFLIPSAVTSNGQIYFAPTGSLTPYPMVFMTTVSFPLLESVAGNFICIFQPQLFSFSAPLLTNVGGDFLVGSNASLEVLELPVIDTVGGDMDIGAQLLVDVDIHTLTEVGGNLSVGGNLVETVNIDGLTTFDGNFSCGVSALTQAAVNYLLVRMDELVLTGKTVTLNNGSSASPSGAGLTAKTALEGRGCTVLVN